MRLSCNGCRVLRKGCSENCSIRACLDWIKSPDSQANATVFLAKFYGRAGLMNLITAGPTHLRPAIFRSLLYEACGRIVNPIYGSVGLMWSGSWQLCQNAVEAVLKGDPIIQIATDVAESKKGPPLKAFDIRHVTNNKQESNDLHRVRTRCRFKRTASKRTHRVCLDSVQDQDEYQSGNDGEVNRSPSHVSSLSHQSGPPPPPAVESDSLGSAETAEPAEADHGNGVEPNLNSSDNEVCEIELDLTLGFEPVKRCVKPKDLTKNEDGFCRMELGLDSPARRFTISFDDS